MWCQITSITRHKSPPYDKIRLVLVQVLFFLHILYRRIQHMHDTHKRRKRRKKTQTVYISSTVCLQMEHSPRGDEVRRKNFDMLSSPLRIQSWIIEKVYQKSSYYFTLSADSVITYNIVHRLRSIITTHNTYHIVLNALAAYFCIPVHAHAHTISISFHFIQL